MFSLHIRRRAMCFLLKNLMVIVSACLFGTCSRSEEESTSEESVKWSAFPLLLACWTALFLAASNCSSATKSSYDRNLSLGIENSYLTGILFLFWALKFYVSVQMDLVPMPSNQSFIFFMWFECHHLPATLQVTTSDPRTDGRTDGVALLRVFPFTAENLARANFSSKWKALASSSVSSSAYAPGVAFLV